MQRPADAPTFVTKRPDSFHLGIDLDELARTLAASPVPEEPRNRIVGPFDLHAYERFWRRRSGGDPRTALSDWFLFGTGEPPHRAMTKLGGLPYLPASTPWPQRGGTWGHFYAQLNFVDSKDLVPSLPGDVLPVFRFHDLDCTSWDEELYGFVWVDVRDQELVRAEDVPSSRTGAPPWPVMHGYRVRMRELPSPPDRTRSLQPEDPLRWRVHATKIGGVATDVQSAWTHDVPGDHRFLGEITAVWPAVDTPYPVVNRAAPVSPFPAPEYQALSSGPGDGVTSLYLDALGNVRVYFSCA